MQVFRNDGFKHGNYIYHMVTLFTMLPQYITMSLHGFSQILSNKAAIAVLKALLRYKGKVFTIRELARTCGFSHPEVSNVVKELEKRAVIKLQPVGRAYQIALNEESYILSIVEQLFEAEEKAIEELIKTIRPFFKNKAIISALIFGSVARGEEKESSDLDLLVITKDKDIAIECAANATDAILPKFGIALSPLVMKKEHVTARQNKKFIASVLESYIHVYGKDLKEMG